ncbi:MAG: hypothetical protein HYY26_04945 [Acidobacteria bacterium]|nr:hypothetical protein [Acidobacteriota bacterium]
MPAVAEEEEEFLLRYNVMGVALSPEAFQKLRQEISLTPRPLRQTLFGQEEVATLYCGTVPLGQRFEKLIVREARLARLHLPDRRVVDWTPQHYYEVCVSPALYEQFTPSAA